MRFFKFLAVQVVVGLLPVVIVVSANLHVPFNEVTKASVSIDHDHQQSAIALLSKPFTCSKTLHQFKSTLSFRRW